MKHKLLAAFIVLCAAVLIISHARLPHNFASWMMAISHAALRSEETLAVVRPQGTVDVNTAPADVLDELKGVGPVLAQAIIDEREQNGPFYYPEDLIAVKGIGEKTLDKMWEELRLP